MTERKRLKAIRRRNKKIKSHNFNTKTLPKSPHIFDTDDIGIRKVKMAIQEWIKRMRTERRGDKN